MSRAQYLIGDVFDRMAEIPDGSVDVVVTSPPFLALRSYLPADHPDKGKEIGSEATPAAFLTTLLALTREWRRILAPHGSLCVELGDTYSGSGGAGGDYNADGLRAGQPTFRQRKSAPGSGAGGDLRFTVDGKGGRGWPLAKSLCLLPTLYPASLAYGRNLLDPDDTIQPWRIRNQIVWHRPNPPVGALGDKVRPSTSYVTVACVAADRWFDLDAERTPYLHPAANTHNLNRGAPTYGLKGPGNFGSTTGGAPPLDCWHDTATPDVWTIPTQAYKGSHYATMAIELPRRLVNLMCPRQVCVTCGQPRRRLTRAADGYAENLGTSWADREAGRRKASTTVRNSHSAQPTGTQITAAAYETVGWSDCGHDNWRRGVTLDPFAGSGTTLAAASGLGRDSIGIDLDPRNLHLARERCGMFLESESA